MLFSDKNNIGYVQHKNDHLTPFDFVCELLTWYSKDKQG